MLALDLMGPLPRSKNGKTMLLVVVDHFTKWVELFALRDAKADRICEILESEIFSRWGSPKSILSDNATNFRGNVFAKMCKSWGIHHKFATPYHPQCNLTERINRSVKNVIISYVHSNHKKWDEYLSSTALALRTAVSDTTGFSPCLLNLGREIALPFDRNLENFSDDFESRIDYQSELVKNLAIWYDKAVSNICHDFMFLSYGKATRKKASSISLYVFTFSLITTEYTGAIRLVTFDKSCVDIIFSV
jgi:hypothetical protein